MTTLSVLPTPGLRFKSLGKSGLRVPSVGVGMWSLTNEDEVEKIVMAAIDNGIILFDLSEAHCARGEVELGRIIKKRKVNRKNLVIMTKIYWSTRSNERGLSRKHIIESVKSSLERLQLDYIDVVVLHKVDPVCPMEETVRAMNYVIEQGWTLYWGTARWSPKEIMDAFSACRQFNCMTPLVEQTEYHMFCREKVELYMPELFHKIGVGTMAWSAITTGNIQDFKELKDLFTKFKFNTYNGTFSNHDEEEEQGANEEEEDNVGAEANNEQTTRSFSDKLRDLNNLAISLNCSLSQLAIAWCLKNENINCVLLGAASIDEFNHYIHALQVVPQMNFSVMFEIEEILGNKPRRPAMVSTLAMRSQHYNNMVSVRIDMPDGGAAAAANVAKDESDGDVLSTTSKDRKPSCEESTTAKDSKPKYFLNNAGEVIKRTENNGVTTNEVISVSSIKGKKNSRSGKSQDQ